MSTEIVNHNRVVIGGHRRPSDPPPPHSSNPWNRKIWDTAMKIFSFFKEKIWSGINQTGLIAKRTLQAIVEVCPDLKLRLGKVIATLGLLSGISFLLALQSLPSTFLGLSKNINLLDKEGIVLSSLSLIVNSSDAFDSFITFMSSLAGLELIPMIGFFSLIALPLAIGLLSYASVKGAYNVIRCSIHLYSLPKERTLDNLDSLKEYIKKRIDITDKEETKIRTKYQSRVGMTDQAKKEAIKRKITVLKDRKRNILARQTDIKVVNIMKNLQKHLATEGNDNDVDTANAALRDMRRLMGRKITVGSISTLTNMTFCISLIFTAIFPVLAPVTMPSIGAGRATVMLGSHFYNLFFMDKGLELPDFIK